MGSGGGGGNGISDMFTFVGKHAGTGDTGGVAAQSNGDIGDNIMMSSSEHTDVLLTE